MSAAAAIAELPAVAPATVRALYLGLPTRPGVKASDRIAIQRPTTRRNLKASRASGSLLNLNFNRCWANALNARATAGVKYFCMQHDDVVPEVDWADTLIDELERTGADVLSVVLPLKDERGLTSTTVRNPFTQEMRRLTMREVFRLPETFDAADVAAAGISTCPLPPFAREILLVNTGLWVCRFDAEWVEKFPGFRNGFDGIVKRPDGVYVAQCFPEDWTFSAWAQRAGLKVRATRIVAALHCDGDVQYRNDEPWGTCETDPGDAPKV